MLSGKTLCKPKVAACETFFPVNFNFFLCIIDGSVNHSGTKIIFNKIIKRYNKGPITQEKKSHINLKAFHREELAFNS